MKVGANEFTRLWAETQSEVLAAVARVGESGWYVLGREVEEFETAMTEFTAHDESVGCANGMDAIEMSLKALGLRPGEPVITTPLSAFATALAVVRAGGRPIFCDVNEHGLLDLDQVSACLDAHSDVRFLLPVHLYGHLVDMVELARLRNERRILVIEDAAQAIGATRGGTQVGSVGETACFSFYPTKNLGAIGDGGALSTSSPEVAKTTRALRNYGQSSKYVHDELGLNSRLDELHAAVLRTAFLPRLDAWTRRRRTIAKRYLNEIDHPLVSLLPGPDVEGSVWHLFPVMVRDSRRDDFMQAMRSKGIGVGQHYPGLMSDQLAMEKWGEFDRFGDLSQAQRFTAEEVSLPIHPYLADEEQSFVIDAINTWEP